MRKQNWETAFSDFIEECRDRPFKRGDHDCALFVANCIEVITGVDHGKEFRIPYKNRREAIALLKKKGYGNLEDVATTKLGEPYKSIGFARRGDVVSVKCPEGLALAIIDLSGKRAITTGKAGLEFYPMGQWLKGWSV